MKLCERLILNAAIQEYEFDSPGMTSIYRIIFTIVPLLFSSIWMAFNLRYEKDKIQFKKNSRIELLYCMIQLTIAMIGYYTKWYFVTAVLLITVCLIYIIKINPKYMNRKLVKTKDVK